MAGMTSMSGLALAAFFWGFPSPPTCPSCCAVAISAGCTPPGLTCPSPTTTTMQTGQAGSSKAQTEEVTGRAGLRDKPAQPWGGRQPSRKGSAQWRSTERGSPAQTRARERVQSLALLPPELCTLGCLEETLILFQTRCPGVGSGKPDSRWDQVWAERGATGAGRRERRLPPGSGRVTWLQARD